MKPYSKKTFRDLVLDLLPNLNDLFEAFCEKDHTFIFEYIGPDNQIVTPYEKSQLVLLGIRSNMNGLYKNISEMEMFVYYLDTHCSFSPPMTKKKKKSNLTEEHLPIRMPKLYEFKTIQDIIDFARELTNRDEGFVCWDVNSGLRVKIKSSHYVKLHRMRGNNGEKSMKDIIGLILTGETAEILLYFPELTESVETVNNIINNIIFKIDSTYSKISEQELTQKDFAERVLKLNQKGMKNLFFSARKKGTTPSIELKQLPIEQQITLIDKYIVDDKIQIKI